MARIRKSSIRPNHRKKPSHKGKQCQRGKGLIYDELKERLNLTITLTGKSKLEAKAKAERCSISTLIEELARSTVLEEFHLSADVQSSTSSKKLDSETS
ncbi:hypothetical protein H6F61_22085 [Cyanobacteria bacterium FACHB-472]|nr:hypothetical protein [Cyanobacteria bacterium FACHB-472]